MKRLIASVLAASMLIALCACGAKDESETKVDAEVENEEIELVGDGEVADDEVNAEVETEAEVKTEDEGSKAPSKNESKPQANGGGLKVESEGGLKVESGENIVIEGEMLEITPVEPSKPVESKPQASTPAASTVGTALQAAFKSAVSANASISAQDLADKLLANEVIKFSGAAMPVEPGVLTGFDNAEIKGFSEGVMFAPMIGSIAFVGYVFTLDAGTDAAAFVSNLKANANPRWNICTEAEETVVDTVGNKVFFVMCPKNMSE